MRTVDGYYNPKGTILKVMCNCGNIFDCPTWHKTAQCPKCRTKEDLEDIKKSDTDRILTAMRNTNE